MKMFLVLLIFISFPDLIFGQKIYRADREAYKSNKFASEFYLYKDSICYLKGHYPNNSIYFLYKGYLEKKSDTLYEFKFQPIVQFGCNKRFGNGDSLIFNITQRDTILTSLTYKMKLESKPDTIVKLESGYTIVHIKGVGKENIRINTKFVDPLTKKIIYMTVNTLSEPDLEYFGVNTAFEKLQILIDKNRLIIYPDHKFIQDKETFKLKE